MNKSLYRLDLNLLLTMQVLLQERSVTKTAKKLGVTQSAISKSLNKLRDWFGDPLFIREPHGLKPTLLALSMEQELSEWFQLGAQLTGKKAGIMPSGVEFQIMTESPLHVLSLAQLPLRIAQQYPQSHIRIRDWDYDSLEAIINGEADIALCGRETHHRSHKNLEHLPYFIDYEVIFEDRPIVYVRDDHPVLQQSWGLDAFLFYAHVSKAWELKDRWALDEVLASKGMARNVTVSVPDFDQTLYMTAQPGHEMITTAPAYYKSYASERYPNLVALPIPLEEDDYQELTVRFTLMWHKRNGRNAKITWLRTAIKELMLGRI